jgi:hypothetical protein
VLSCGFAPLTATANGSPVGGDQQVVLGAVLAAVNRFGPIDVTSQVLVRKKSASANFISDMWPLSESDMFAESATLGSRLEM